LLTGIPVTAWTMKESLSGALFSWTELDIALAPDGLRHYTLTKDEDDFIRWASSPLPSRYANSAS